MSAPLLGTSVPARIVRRSNTTLYHVAVEFLGDASQAQRIADLNGFSDFWIVGETLIRIPSRRRSTNRAA